LRAGVGGAMSNEPVVASFVNGRRKTFWNRNCVALGAAAGFLEPLESTGLHLIQSGITRLLQLLPARTADGADIDEYNRLTAAEYEQIRDFLILHYHASGYGKSPLWDHCRTMAIPETLAYRMAMFKSRGRVAPQSGDVFFLPNWLSIFAGLNIQPRRYHPFADGLGVEKLRQQMDLIRGAVHQAAETMPSHAAVVAQSLARAM
jgi:tryptophan halogenase